MIHNRIAHVLAETVPQPRTPFFLIAEDNPDDRMLLSYAFSSAKVVPKPTLSFVHDGEELLTYLADRTEHNKPLPDFLLLDLNLPKKDGIEALTEIRRTPSIQDLPVVVLTSSTSVVDREQVERLAAVEFATKPDEFEALVRFVERLIGFFHKTAK